MSGLPIAWELVQSVLLVGSALLLAGLTYNLASILRRIGPESPPDSLLRLGAAAPELRSRDVRTGQPMVLAELSRAGCPALIAFLSPGCRTCVQEVSGLNKLAAKDMDLVVIAVVDEGTGENSLQTIDERVWIVEDRGHELAEAFEVRKIPFVYVIDRNGQVSMRAVTNTRLDLEDALDGAGHLQQTAWVPVEDGR